MELDQMLKDYRKKNGMTQEQLAEKIFVSNKTISNWETGKTMPDIESLIRLANLFDFSLDNLLLEGSAIVENIKKDKEVKILKRIRIASLTIAICVFVIFILSKFSEVFPDSITLHLFLLAIAISNLFISDYIGKKLQVN